MLNLYVKNHLEKDDERLGLFEQIRDNHDITKVLYPGSYAHLTPAFIFPIVYFNDTYNKLVKYYESEEIFEFIQKNKHYGEEPTIIYIPGDFEKPLPIKDQDFDLIISQYAGFISLYCKRYLTIGGILLANNSHGDASMASIDPDYEFIAVINNRGGEYVYSSKNLGSYFKLKKNIEVTREYLQELRRGIGYTKSASNYVFKRVS